MSLAIGPELVGAAAGPLEQEIDARWLMAYAGALGETDPRCFDTITASGPVAHPLFPVCYEWPLALALRDQAVGDAIAPLGVHATHDVAIHRPPRAGEGYPGGGVRPGGPGPPRDRRRPAGGPPPGRSPRSPAGPGTAGAAPSAPGR